MKARGGAGCRDVINLIDALMTEPISSVLVAVWVVVVTSQVRSTAEQ
jgi:hypothetical protein